MINADRKIGNTAMWTVSICPTFKGSNRAPTPKELNTFLDWSAIHCEFKLLDTRPPVYAVNMQVKKAITPLAHMEKACPFHAERQKLIMKCRMIDTKKICTDQKWMPWTKRVIMHC